MNTPPLVEMLEVSDPAELAESCERHAQFEKNSAWLQAHLSEVYSQHRGKVICIAGQELFASESPTEAWDRAHLAHPEDRGVLLRYIPKEKVPRIYAF